MQQIAGRLGPNARQFLDYWTSLPMRALVPDRANFDPMAIARLLPVVSILERTGDDDWRFRLAGTEIERRWAMRLTGASYLDIDFVSRRAADTMRREFRQIVERPCGSWSQRGVVFRSGRGVSIETLRLPLRAANGSISLIISCSSEFRSRTGADSDEPREIIRITEQLFVDIGAGCPAVTALDDAS